MNKLIKTVRNLPSNIISSAAGGTVNVICAAIAQKRIASFSDAMALICAKIEAGEIQLQNVFSDNMSEEQSTYAWDEMIAQTRAICEAL